MMTRTFICLVLLLASCSRYSDELEKALHFAGENRYELEKVLDHYSRKPEDSLKLRAAKFLITNMPGKGSIYSRYYDRKGNELQISSMKSLSDQALAYQKDSIMRLIARKQQIVEPDLEYITSGYLIDQIDCAFEAWQYPWARNIPFDEFCLHILPYRCFTEPLSADWRAKAMTRYHWLQDSMRNIHDPVEACCLINRDLKRWFDGGYHLLDYKPSVDSIMAYRYGACEEMSCMAAYLMRAMGLAITIDQIPYWPMQGLGHTWCTVRDSTGKQVKFNPIYDDPGTEFGMYDRYAKVYRKEYVINQESPLLRFQDYDFIPLFRQIDLFDITDLYTTTCEITDTVEKVTEPGLVYLAVYNGGEWKPTAYAVVQNDSFRIHHVGNGGILYQWILNNQQGIPISESHPFILEHSCKIYYLSPDYSNCFLLQVQQYARHKPVVDKSSYDLYYYSQGWKYLQTSIADNGILTYTNVPANALLMLQLSNTPKNVDIRPFVMIEGKQIFK